MTTFIRSCTLLRCDGCGAEYGPMAGLVERVRAMAALDGWRITRHKKRLLDSCAACADRDQRRRDAEVEEIKLARTLRQSRRDAELAEVKVERTRIPAVEPPAEPPRPTPAEPPKPQPKQHQEIFTF